jgi:hypothetical protein
MEEQLGGGANLVVKGPFAVRGPCRVKYDSVACIVAVASTVVKVPGGLITANVGSGCERPYFVKLVGSCGVVVKGMVSIEDYTRWLQATNE